MFLTKVFRFLDPKGPSLKTGIRVFRNPYLHKVSESKCSVNVFIYLYLCSPLAENVLIFFIFVFVIARWLKKSNFFFQEGKLVKTTGHPGA